MNTLYFGDNLKIMRQYVKDETVDLIYLDPPFNSNATYNVLFADKTGKKSDAQIKAFEDTWEWNEAAAQAYDEIVQHGGHPSEAIQAFRLLLGTNDMMAYLSMMGIRLIELRRVLKPTGSIYLHCDPTASHYLKVLMDAIFGKRFFRNEIIWCYRKWSITQDQFVRNHDVILFYSKSAENVFNTLFVEPSEGTMKRWKGKKQQAVFVDGVRKATTSEDGTAQSPMPDWWQISILNPNSHERLGYPTQKPEALIERIVKASSNEGDVVLDPFCGCGTSVTVSQRLNREWIGIDVTYLAIDLIRRRLKDTFSKQAQFEVVGIPTNIDEARELALESRHQFETWACGLIDARIVGKKKGADKGIDGKIEFKVDDSGQYHKIMVSVKSGQPDIVQLRDLEGVVAREKAAIGVLVLLEKPTGPMKKEAAASDYFISPWGKHRKIQILTIEDIFNGKGIDYPKTAGANVTFRQAQKAKEDTSDLSPMLPLDTAS